MSFFDKILWLWTFSRKKHLSKNFFQGENKGRKPQSNVCQTGTVPSNSLFDIPCPVTSGSVNKALIKFARRLVCRGWSTMATRSNRAPAAGDAPVSITRGRYNGNELSIPATLPSLLFAANSLSLGRISVALLPCRNVDRLQWSRREGGSRNDSHVCKISICQKCKRLESDSPEP